MPVHTIDWYRTPITPETLETLNRRSDWRGFLQAGGHLACMTATATLALLVHRYLSWPWLLVALFLHGTICAFTINAVHELVHGTVFKSSWLNNLFVHIYAFLGWHNHYVFWASHTEHHKFTLHAPDDLEVVLPSKQVFRHFLKYGFVHPYAIYGNVKDKLGFVLGRFKGEWVNHILPAEDRRARRNIRLWSVFLLVGHAAIIGVCLARGNWLIPVLISGSAFYGALLFFFCNNTQHTGLADYVPDFRLCCRSIALNPVVKFLYWHMNFHIEHHMYAGVPCYNLGALHEALKHDLPEMPNGLVETWSHIFYIQYRQRIDPKYQYIAPLPGQATPAEYQTVPRTQRDANSTNGGVTGNTPTLNSRGEPFRRWECSVCGLIYDEQIGLPEEGIVAGTAWLDIPEDWHCPDCGVAKSDFNMVEITAAVATQQ